MLKVLHRIICNEKDNLWSDRHTLLLKEYGLIELISENNTLCYEIGVGMCIFYASECVMQELINRDLVDGFSNGSSIDEVNKSVSVYNFNNLYMLLGDEVYLRAKNSISMIDKDIENILLSAVKDLQRSRKQHIRVNLLFKGKLMEQLTLDVKNRKLIDFKGYKGGSDNYFSPFRNYLRDTNYDALSFGDKQSIMFGYEEIIKALLEANDLLLKNIDLLSVLKENTTNALSYSIQYI